VRESEIEPTRLWLYGCGNMGGAMLRRWISSGVIDPTNVTVIDRARPPVPEGVRVFSNDADAYQVEDQGADIVVLAVKPQQLPELKLGYLGSMAPSLLISILAGVDQESLAGIGSADAVVRAMPNLPVAIGKGVVALQTGSADAGVRRAAEALMQPLGLVEWIADESLFDAVTALSGCGPGFVYRFIDALADAGAALGIPADQAQRLAIATVEGSGMLAAQADASPATLADRVASPGGSTREGLNVLDRDYALKALLRQTLAASERRNAEMAAAARK
jgi:pyrroline-5-carboxylate reductase